jgi:hypothetical protein
MGQLSGLDRLVALRLLLEALGGKVVSSRLPVIRGTRERETLMSSR